MLRVFNDLTRRVEPFLPQTPGAVSLYVCGVTVYDLCHLGHARCYITWDVVRRYLEFSGYRVHHVQNFTDVDDKILNRAREQGEDPVHLARRFEAEYFADMDRLGILRAHSYPRATEHIGQMLSLVDCLVQSANAYPTSDGTVYFDVASFPRYGKLSGRDLDDLSQRTRLDEPDPSKHNPADFALWKGAKPGESSWDSPWGAGRPGWHLECSAMALDQLGKTIDIHAGGMDLIFPHHENEIAQSEACTHEPFVRYWLHNGFVNVDAEKMSKSLGNFSTIRQLLDRYDPQAVRYFLLQTHYRQDCDFSSEPLEAAGNALKRLQRSLADRQAALAAPTVAVTEQIEQLARAFTEAMDDDFNTPRAVASLWEARARLGDLEGADRAAAGHVVARIREFGAVLGLDLAAKAAAEGDRLAAVLDIADQLREIAARYEDDDLAEARQASASQLIEALLTRRTRAKKARDFATADGIRAMLSELGITLADQPGGVTRWELASGAAPR